MAVGVPATATLGVSTVGQQRYVEEQLSVADVATRLHVNESTVWRWIKRGELGPVRKLGRLVRVPASVVNQFLEVRTV
jgi:excisionase family DNA binding protein